MARREHDPIVEAPPEVQLAGPGPTVLALSVISAGLAVLILSMSWFVFFRA